MMRKANKNYFYNNENLYQIITIIMDPMIVLMFYNFLNGVREKFKEAEIKGDIVIEGNELLVKDDIIIDKYKILKDDNKIIKSKL